MLIFAEIKFIIILVNEMDKDFRSEELKILEETYRGAIPELKFDSVFELLVAVILSAQCTDKRVNQVTKILFPIANTPEKILQLGQTELEKIIKPCGYFHAKAKYIIETSKILLNISIFIFPFMPGTFYHSGQ